MKLKKGSIALLTLAGMFYMSVQKADACTRAVYIGPDNMVITGRTMDWKEDIMSNIYVFPRGIQRAGYNKENGLTRKTLCLPKDHRQSIEKKVKIYNPSELSSKLLYL